MTRKDTRVEAGVEIVTRRGKPVARLVRPREAIDPAKAQQAAAAIRAMSRGITLGGAKIGDLIGEGRR